MRYKNCVWKLGEYLEYFKTRITFRCRGHVRWTHVRFYTMTHVFDFQRRIYMLIGMCFFFLSLLLYILDYVLWNNNPGVFWDSSAVLLLLLLLLLLWLWLLLYRIKTGCRIGKQWIVSGRVHLWALGMNFSIRNTARHQEQSRVRGSCIITINIFYYIILLCM